VYNFNNQQNSLLTASFFVSLRGKCWLVIEQWQQCLLPRRCEQLRADWFCKDAVCSHSPRLVSRIICMLLFFIVTKKSR